MKMLQQKIILFFGFAGVIVSVAGDQSENIVVFIAGIATILIGFALAKRIDKYARIEKARRKKNAMAREKVFRFYKENKLEERVK